MTTWSWPSSTASRVCSMNAETSLARKFSPVAAADDERGVAARADHDAGGVRVDGEQGEGALQPPADPAHRLGQLAPAPGRPRPRPGPRQLRLEQVGGGLGVGVADELDAVGLQLGPQLGEVLDDAVVDHGDPAAGRAVRVRVAVGRTAVGGPAGVPDAGRAGGDPGRVVAAVHRPSASALLQVGQLAGPLAGQQRAVVDHGHAGRVVPAVLQPPQAVQHDAERRSGARVPHDSAHGPHHSGTSLSPRAQKADFHARHLIEAGFARSALDGGDSPTKCQICPFAAPATGSAPGRRRCPRLRSARIKP